MLLRRLDHLVSYDDGLALQRETHAARVAGQVDDTTLLLQHHPVYTAGKRTEPFDRPVGDPGAPVVDVDRGGKITWHGPGQLTGYPIVALPPMGAPAGGDPLVEASRNQMVDVVAYVRHLEDVLIAACAAFGVAGERVAGRSGVWVRRAGTPDAKVAAIGVRVARGVTMHGFALNADCDLAWFDRIVPCGIRDAGVTSLTEVTGSVVTVADVLPVVERELLARLAPAVV